MSIVEWMFASLWYYTVLMFKFFFFLLHILTAIISAILNRRQFSMPPQRGDLLARSRQRSKR